MVIGSVSALSSQRASLLVNSKGTATNVIPTLSFTGDSYVKEAKVVKPNIFSRTAKNIAKFAAGLSVVGLSMTGMQSCQKDDPIIPDKPDTTIVKPPVDTTGVKPPVDTTVVKPPILELSQTQKNFVQVAPDVFVLDSASAVKVAKNVSKDSVLLEDGGGYVSYKLVPSKTSKDTIVLTKTTYDAVRVKQGEAELKFYADNGTSSSILEGKVKATGVTSKATLVKDGNGTTQIIKNIKRNLYTSIDQYSSRRTNLADNMWDLLKRVK